MAYTGLWYGNDIAGGHDAATASRDIFIEDDLWGNFHINVLLFWAVLSPDTTAKQEHNG